MDEIKYRPFDFHHLFSLREIIISSFGSAPKRHLHALCKLLGLRESAVLSPNSESSFTIEIVRLHMRWGSTAVGTARTLFEDNDPACHELDRILNGSPLFRRLKIVEIRIGVTIDNAQRSGRGEMDSRGLKTKMSSDIKNLFCGLRTSKAVKFSIVIDYQVH
jgi:hypothetical protein